jgi:hypothetical protein
MVILGMLGWEDERAVDPNTCNQFRASRGYSEFAYNLW